jgi:hypothetical protein
MTAKYSCKKCGLHHDLEQPIVLRSGPTLIGHNVKD